MLTKRIIPCLDIKDGRVVKGSHFFELKDAGDPIALAQKYSKQGADELVFLDISATNENRKTLQQLVREIAKHINIPFTVGGGISTPEDVKVLLENGADKISLNTAAVQRPECITEIASRFGSQCVVVAVDTKKVNKVWQVVTHGGRKLTNLKTIEWVKEVENRGAGEIMLTSIESDGTKNGFSLDITKEVSQNISIPVIASGGAGTMAHFVDVFKQAHADAALAAKIFHYNQMDIISLKEHLKEQKIPIRI